MKQTIDIGDDIRVLHIEDEEPLADLTALQLEKIDERISVFTETDAERCLDRLHEDAPIDCIVSDYNMPSMNGIELLETVRERHPDLPFILFTGRGSEEVAASAITAGVTDYLQKETGTDQYKVLANRIANTVEQYRAVKEVEATKEFYGRILEQSSDYVFIVGASGVIDYISPSVERVMGYPPEELMGTNSFEFLHPEDQTEAFDALAKVVEYPDQEVTVEYRSKHADGSWRWIEVRGGNFLDDPFIEGVMVNVRDVTRRKQQERDLERQRQRLKELTRFMSHDMKNQLSVAKGNLDLIGDAIENERLEVADTALTRVDEMIDKIGELVESGPAQIDPEPIDLAAMSQEAWMTVKTPDADIEIACDGTILADESRMRSLLENLFGNAIQHGGSAVTVRLGAFEDEDNSGFFVENDGQGLPVDDPSKLFESGYTTDPDGTGLGLSIVKQVIDSHGWTIDVSEPRRDSVRFEIGGVDYV